MKKVCSFIIALFAMCICFSFNVYAEDSEYSIKEGEEKTVDVNSTGEYSAYDYHGDFRPTKSGFYDVTLKAEGNLDTMLSVYDVVKEDISECPCQVYYLASNTKNKNVCYLLADHEYIINFFCFDMDRDGKKAVTKVTYSISYNNDSIENISETKKSVSIDKPNRVVFSYKTTNEGMYSLICDTDKEFIGIICKKSEMGKDLTENMFYLPSDYIGNSHDVKLEANTEYYIMYFTNDETVKNGETVKLDLSVKKRNIKSVNLELVDDTIAAFERIDDKVFKCTVTYDDGDMLTTQGKLYRLSFLEVNDVDEEISSQAKVGKHTITGSYMGQTFSTTVNVISNTEYCKEKSHTKEKIKAVPATYTHVGKTEGLRCSVCGAIIKAQKTIKKKQLQAPKISSVSSKSSGVVVKWSKAKDATGYVVYRKNGVKGKYVKVATCKNKTVSFTDKKVKKSKNKKTYYYTVKAIRTEKVSKKNVTVTSKTSNVKSVKR